MIKCEIITKKFSGYESIITSDIETYNGKIKSFLEHISVEGHTFISLNTIAFGENRNWLRTEITYRENQTREVLFEKTE